MVRRLRVVHTESSGGWGGQDMRVLAESIGLIERGHRVSIVTAGNHRLHQEALKRGVPTVDLPLYKKRPREFWALRSWLAANAADIDILNTHSSTDAWLVAGVGLTLGTMPPVIRTRHVSSPVSRRLTTRWLYQRSIGGLCAGAAGLSMLAVASCWFPQPANPIRPGSNKTNIRFFIFLLLFSDRKSVV